MSAIKDINLAPSGAHKIDWVRKNCPLLRSLEDDFSKESFPRMSIHPSRNSSAISAASGKLIWPLRICAIP